MTGPCVEQPEQIPQPCQGPHGRPGVGDDRSLVDRDGRGKSFDGFYAGSFETPHELPGIGRERAEVATFRFPEKDVVNQGGFSGSRNAGDYDQLVAGEGERDRAEVMLGGTGDGDGSGHGAKLVNMPMC